MTYYDSERRAVVRVTCGGEPLDGLYLPPASDLALLGRLLARKYGAKGVLVPEKNIPTGRQPDGD